VDFGSPGLTIFISHGGKSMPIFEFVCKSCDRLFEELLRSASLVDQVACPNCGSPQVRKKISTFASKVSGGASFSLGSSQSSCSTGST
jgi:putative FmdB family regulatory protein